MSGQRSARRALFLSVLGLAFVLTSCTGLPEPAPSPTETQDTSAVPDPSTSMPTGPSTSSSPTQASLSSTPGEDASSVAWTTFAGEMGDVQYSFDHPANWIVEDRVRGFEGGGVNIFDADMAHMANLGIPPMFLEPGRQECSVDSCAERPVVYLGDWAGQGPLSVSGPFVVRSMATDLSAFPQLRKVFSWAGNVRVGTFLSSSTGPAPTTSPAGLPFGEGIVETEVADANGRTQRNIRFSSARDFGMIHEAYAYAGSDEHRKIQAMIASFRERKD